MSRLPVIAVFDIGKTNKKRFLFDELYNVVEELTSKFEETIDDDGEHCENLEALTSWIKQSMDELFTRNDVAIKAVNVSTYGASFVHLGSNGQPVAALYNYLKAYPAGLDDKLYDQYEGKLAFSKNTACPALGNLNSGLQLYWLKNEKPEIYSQIWKSLHLPQYITYLFTGRTYSDITSIGCHTALWNFPQNSYHEWLYKEGVMNKLAPIFPSDQAVSANWKGASILCGVGLHDSSAALIPYLAGFKDKFLLISTGTWCISLNPFNQTKLSNEELTQDCLCYLEYRGNPIKASRLFAGYFHEKQVVRLAKHFNTPENHYQTVAFNPALLKISALNLEGTVATDLNVFAENDLTGFTDYETAYHHLTAAIVEAQVHASNLVMNDAPVGNIFVDGGFSKNPIYMTLLATAYPHIKVYAASVAQATALGAALSIHRYWNSKPTPENLIQLKQYAALEKDTQ